MRRLKTDLSELNTILPEFIKRSEIEKHLSNYLGNIFTKRTMKHFDSYGTGPKRLKIGRFICYKKKDLIEWLESKISTLN